MESNDRSTGLARIVTMRRAAASAPRTLAPLPSAARRVVVASIALLVVGCSSIRLGYNNADTLLLYGLNSYLDLDDAQERLARERIRELHAWHRATQLPDYAQLLRDAERAIEGGIGAAEVLELQGRMNAALAALGEQAAPALAELAATLRAEQIARLQKRLADDTSKARREFVRIAGRETPDERARRIGRQAESWLGPLSAEQQQIVRERVAGRPPAQWWLDERERRQRELVEVLTRIRVEQPERETGARWLRQYFASLATPIEAERRARTLEFRADNAELIAQLISSATPQQKASLLKRVRGYAADFTTLASTGGRG